MMVTCATPLKYCHAPTTLMQYAHAQMSHDSAKQMRAATMSVYVAILVFSLAALCGRVQCAEKVQLGFYSESLCPDCIDFANGPLEEAMNKACVFCYGRTP